MVKRPELEPAVEKGGNVEAPLPWRDRLADQVLLDEGRAVVRPHLTEDDHLWHVRWVCGDGDDQEEIGEREVGEHPPRPEEALEMAELLGR